MSKSIVYEVVTRKNNTTYRHTKIKCATPAEAERELHKYEERTGRFHNVREVKR